MNTKKNILTIFLSFVIIGTAFPQDGKSLFNANCTACHTLGGGILVGPDLKGSTGKHTEDWMIKWIKGSQKMVEQKDAQALELFNKYNMIPMPDQTISDAEIKAVIAYIKSESGGDATADAKKEDKKTDKDTTAKPTVASDNNSSGNVNSKSDKASSSVTSVNSNNTSKPEDQTPANPDNMFLIFGIGGILVFFLVVIYALGTAVKNLSSALAIKLEKEQ